MIFKIILPVVLVDLTQNPARIADGYHICRQIFRHYAAPPTTVLSPISANSSFKICSLCIFFLISSTFALCFPLYLLLFPTMYLSVDFTSFRVYASFRVRSFTHLYFL